MYHSTTARYNGHFNAKELIRIAMEDYSRNYREDYTRILPIDLYPNEEDVTDMYPILDTAIAKCEAVISKHSMPTASKPSQKKEEHANWVDQNWLLIGKAQFIRRNYQKALDNFEYIRKFYIDRSSTYTAQMWEARCHIALGDLSQAQRTIQKLEGRKQDFLGELGGGNRFIYDQKLRKMRRKQQKIDVPPVFPKILEFELEKTKAELALERKEYDQALRFLKESLRLARKKKDKARLNFIIGQLLQLEEDPAARIYFTATIKKNPSFEMEFQAKINRAMVGGKGEDEIIKELMKMTEEQRYLEYKDQIYYAMATVELSRNDRKQGKYYLSKSAFYSLNNERQKGISYELLGDLHFEERKYVPAQKYFDSSAQVIPKDYHNAELIETKATQLKELVNAIDVVNREDSLQRIAKMPEEERLAFLEETVEQLKEEERLRKEREKERAEKIRQLQMQQAQASAGAGNKFYFNNPKNMQSGFEEFRSMWGQRENEDHWRRSNKELVVDFDKEEEEETDTVPEKIDPEEVPVDELTPEILAMNLPLTDSAMAQSNEMIMEALYRSGMVYKEQLNETKLGAKQFQKILDKNIEDKHNVLAAFQLYKINEGSPQKASVFKNYIITNYPNSDYANFLRDPDYFIKKKELDALAQKEYLASIERFERGLYFPVISKSKDVIENDPDNKYRAQYFILKAMAMGQVNNDKTTLIPVLEQAIEEYPETPTAERAQELLGFIRDGVPTLDPLEFNAGSDIYEFEYDTEMYAIIILKSNDDTRDVQTKVSNFNREFFSRERLRTSSQMLGPDKTIIKVSKLEDEKRAQEYMRDYKKTKKHLGDLRNNKIMYISPDNYKALVKERKLEEYEQFFLNNY